MKFNADGSLNVGTKVNKLKEEKVNKMKNTRCITITKNVTSSDSPKLCTILIETSPLVEPSFVENNFGFFSKRAKSTVKLIKISDREFQITIGGEFSRCKDCQLLSYMFREYLEGNIIENKGSCTYKGVSRTY